MKTQDYLDLPYSIIIKKITDESGTYYHAAVQELEGCQSTADSFEEAYTNIYEAMEGWIETKLENGFEVPKPLEENNYSGKFVLRIPKTLHKKLALAAEKEGVSLNQYALYKLS